MMQEKHERGEGLWWTVNVGLKNKKKFCSTERRKRNDASPPPCFRLFADTTRGLPGMIHENNDQDWGWDRDQDQDRDQMLRDVICNHFTVNYRLEIAHSIPALL